jgi:hypothetical protein
MATTEPLSQQALANINALISERARNLVSRVLQGAGDRPLSAQPGQPSLTLHESMPIWTLPLSAVSQSDRPLSTLAKYTFSWHHQLHINNNPLAYAVTKQKGDDANSHSFASLGTRELSKTIDTALAKLDQEGWDDTVVRFLTIPSYLLEGLWLHQKDRDWVIPLSFPPNLRSLNQFTEYQSVEFLVILREQPPVKGVPLREGDSSTGGH